MSPYAASGSRFDVFSNLYRLMRNKMRRLNESQLQQGRQGQQAAQQSQEYGGYSSLTDYLSELGVETDPDQALRYASTDEEEDMVFRAIEKMHLGENLESPESRAQASPAANAMPAAIKKMAAQEEWEGSDMDMMNRYGDDMEEPWNPMPERLRNTNEDAMLEYMGRTPGYDESHNPENEKGLLEYLDRMKGYDESGTGYPEGGDMDMMLRYGRGKREPWHIMPR